MPNSLTTNVTVPGIWEMKEEEEKFMKENLCTKIIFTITGNNFPPQI